MSPMTYTLCATVAARYSDGMRIRHATMADADAIAAVEAECFPAAEAATADEVRDRLSVYPDHFWLMVDDGSDDDVNGHDGSDHGGGHDDDHADATAVADGRLVAFVNGFATNEPDLTDAMYADAAMHDEHGAWQMIFGVDTAPDYQHRGHATRLLRRVIDDARLQGRSGLVLTCKDRLIGFYARLGFKNEGISGSTHGDVVWYQMRLRL